MIQEIFGSLVFNEQAMRSRLPKKPSKPLPKLRKTGKPLSEEVADVVANAMKDWAVEKGCTHFTHWFQPLTGVTAEKHEAFQPRWKRTGHDGFLRQGAGAGRA